MSNTKVRRSQRYPQAPAQDVLKIRKLIKAKTQTQHTLMSALIQVNIPLVLALGPAGTGKTYLAIHAALRALADGEVNKIVLTRPVVEAEENLGFLPGDLEEKLHPYLIPLMDAVNDLIGPTMAKQLRESGVIEIAPLAFMRGRTFNDCFLVGDEIQNATVGQVKLLVTRIGENCKMSLNGDSDQCDLKGQQDGIGWLASRLTDADPRVAIVRFKASDAVRSEMVKMLLKYITD
jgi:phosphate starvation-inducible PhoH-like protein